MPASYCSSLAYISAKSAYCADVAVAVIVPAAKSPLLSLATTLPATFAVDASTSNSTVPAVPPPVK